MSVKKCINIDLGRVGSAKKGVNQEGFLNF